MCTVPRADWPDTDIVIAGSSLVELCVSQAAKTLQHLSMAFVLYPRTLDQCKGGSPLGKLTALLTGLVCVRRLGTELAQLAVARHVSGSSSPRASPPCVIGYAPVRHRFIFVVD